MSEQRSRGLTNKTTLIGMVLLSGAAGLLASVQPWLTLQLQPGSATVEELEVTGQQMSPALTLVALAALAAAIVLTIAGRGFRRVIGVLIVALGAGLSLSGVQARVDPLAGASGELEQVSGISGEAQRAVVTSVSVSVWPTVSVTVGVLLAIAGVLVLVFSPSWKAAGRKYESGGTPAKARAAGVATGDRISDWDALSDGEDPTGDDGDEADIEWDEPGGPGGPHES